MTKLEELKQIASRRTPGEWVVSAPLENDHREYLNEIEKSYYAEQRKAENDNPVINVAGEKIIPNFYDYEEAGVPRFDAEFIAMAAKNIDKLIAVAEVARRALEEGLWIDGKIYVPELDMTNRERLAKALDALESED